MMGGLNAYNDIVSAYEGVERLDGFSGEQLSAYRQQLLARTGEQAEFIARHVAANASMVEIGAGNGRLLITLTRQGLLREAVGIDVSPSRIEFARRWAEELGLSLIRFQVADALADELPDHVDLIACITGTFAYFDAIRQGAGAQLLARARDALAPGGALVVELYPHAALRRMLESADGHELRLWQELPADDPWRFYLSHLSFSSQNQILTHSKTFIHRTSGEIDAGRREHLRLYDETTIRQELEAAGYREIAAYGDWTGRPHRPDDERLIVTARPA